MTDTLVRSVEKFIDRKYRQSRDRNTAANLLAGTTAKSNSYAFLQQNSIQHLAGKPITSRDVIDQVPVAIKDSIASYTRKKINAINIYKKYLDFLKKEYEINVDIAFPPVFNNDFDRQMFIIKSLHQRRFSAAEIGEELWLSEKTVTTDLAALEEGISILGQGLKLKREENIYSNKERNTIHPVFLSANLTQIVIMLRGLENQSKDKAYQEYAVRLAANIGGELSDYGRQRIMDVSTQLNLNTQWFDILEEKRNRGLYSSESDCSYEEGAGNIINFLKNGKHCTVEVNREGKSQILKDCLIKAYLGDEIRILHEENEFQLPKNSVIRVTRFSKEIF